MSLPLRRGAILALTLTVLLPCWPALPAGATEMKTSQSAVTSQPAVSSPLAVTRKKSLITILSNQRDVRNDVYTQTLVNIGRFEYFNLSYRNECHLPSVDQMREKFLSYLQQNATAIAARGQKPDLKFGDVAIAGEDLDRLIDSAYVMIPSWEMGEVSLSEGKTVVDKEGVERTETTATGPMTLVNEIVNLRTGEVIALQNVYGAVSRTIKLEIPPKTSNSKKRRLVAEYEAERAAAKIARPERYFADQLEVGARFMMASLSAQIRSVDIFVLRSLVSDRDPRRMTLGQDMGVLPDSTWNVYRKQNSELVNVGFVKVREIGSDDAAFQAIEDRVGFEPGDQLIEHPRAGSDLALRLGLATFDPTGGYGLSPSFGLAAETDLASFLRTSALSEIYTTFDAALLTPANSPMVGYQAAFGFKKRHYINQVALSWGLKVGLAGGSGQVSHTTAAIAARNGDTIPSGSPVSVTSAGVGLIPVVGLEYQSGPDLKFGLEAGVQWFSALQASGVTVSDARNNTDYQYDLSNLPASLRPRDGNATGVTFGLSGTYSF